MSSYKRPPQLERHNLHSTMKQSTAKFVFLLFAFFFLIIAGAQGESATEAERIEQMASVYLPAMISMVDNLWAEFDVWVERVLQLTEPLLEVTAQEDVCPNPAGNVTDDEGNYYALVGSSYRTIFETGRTLRNGHDDYAAKLTQLRSTLVNAQQVLVTYLEMLENQSAEDAAMYYSATGQPAQTAAFSAWQAFTVFDPAHHTGWIRPIFQFPQTFYTWAVESLSGLYGPEQKGMPVLCPKFFLRDSTLAALGCVFPNNDLTPVLIDWDMREWDMNGNEYPGFGIGRTIATAEEWAKYECLFTRPNLTGYVRSGFSAANHGLNMLRVIVGRGGEFPPLIVSEQATTPPPPELMNRYQVNYETNWQDFLEANLGRRINVISGELLPMLSEVYYIDPYTSVRYNSPCPTVVEGPNVDRFVATVTSEEDLNVLITDSGKDAYGPRRVYLNSAERLADDSWTIKGIISWDAQVCAHAMYTWDEAQTALGNTVPVAGKRGMDEPESAESRPRRQNLVLQRTVIFYSLLLDDRSLSIAFPGLGESYKVDETNDSNNNDDEEAVTSKPAFIIGMVIIGVGCAIAVVLGIALAAFLIVRRRRVEQVGSSDLP